MPELPEVETVRRGLASVLENAMICKVELRRSDLRIPFPANLEQAIARSPIVHLSRRAKYILIEFANANILILHLGMSGRMIVNAPENSELYSPSPHDHVVLRLDDGAHVIFRDPRRFGLMTVCSKERMDNHSLFKHLGVEPLESAYSAVYLLSIFKNKRTPIKTALLDQRIVAGLGNIYVNEILFRAHVAPLRKACSLTLIELERIVDATRIALNEAIAAGGSTLRDHAYPTGELGTFQRYFKVYSREGLPCLQCADINIEKDIIAGRASYFCSGCQR